MKNLHPESVLAAQVSNGNTPSLQYLFFDRDKIIYEFNEGSADLSNGMKADKDTVFPVFSVTKTFTAISILQLAGKGLVDLNYPVNRYLPELKMEQGTTVKHLLTHTSGLSNPLPIIWIHSANEHTKFNRDEFFNPVLAKSIKGKQPAGTNFRYSNLGYVILGMVVEKVTGAKYEEYVTGNILSNLDLQQDVIGFDIPAGAKYATGYHNTRNISMLLISMLLNTSKYMGTSTGKWKPFKPVYVNGTSYGGLIANAYGMVKYARALLDRDNMILNEDLRNQMFTENILAGGRNTGMCLSWYTGRLGDQTYFTHAGGGGGFYCEIRLYPGIASGSFVIFNRSGFSDERFLNNVDKYFLV